MLMTLAERAPKIVVTYGILLSALMLLPVRNPHADINHIHNLMNTIALLGAVEFELAKDLLRSRLRLRLW